MEHIIKLFGGERAKSYLWRSFLVSWLIWNWRIFVVLFWYNQADLEGKTYIKFIESNFINWTDSVLIPLAMGLFFTFVVQFCDLGISGFKEWVKRVKYNWELKIKDKMHPTKSEYTSLAAQLSECKSTSSQYKLDKSEAEKDRIEIQKKLNLLNARHDQNSAFSGDFRVIYKGKSEERITIRNSQIRYQEDEKKDEFRNIRHFEAFDNRVLFIVERSKGDFDFFDLYNRSPNYYEGNMNSEPIIFHKLQ